MSGKSDFAREVMRLYAQAGKPMPGTPKQYAEFAVSSGLFTPKAADLVQQCAELLTQGFREDYFTDSQGRRVRRMHAVKRRTLGGEQQVFWDDIKIASRGHMETSIAQRRNGIVHDCLQLKRDVDSYNDAHKSDPPIQLSLSFQGDVDELMEPLTPPIPGTSGPSSTVH